VAAITVYGPQIASVRKNNQIAVERWPLQQRVRSLSADDQRTKRDENHGKKWANQPHLFCS
jgi:hypothetical protein